VGGPQSFPTFPFHHAFYKTMDMSVFKNKIVYIGSTSSILHDNFFSPFSTNDESMPGVEIHANLLDTILSGQYLRFVSGAMESVLILGLGLLTGFLTFKLKPLPGLLVMLLELAAYASLVFYAFLHQNLVLPLVSPLASVFFTFAGPAVWRAVDEERRAREVRGQFSRYVSKAIVDEILKDPAKISLGGTSKEVSILFSDVRGFTAMSESMSAENVVEILNEYLTAMVDIVIANNGTLDKYVGDAVMAVWGSPLSDPEHRRRSVTTAVQMMEKLHELQKKWAKEGRPPIDIGIGVHSGHVIAGNMGHLHYKMDYTVIGDDVNTAARLESANKELRSHIIISGATYEGCKDLVEVVQHPPIKVKGKAKALEVYEVVGWKGKKGAWAIPLPLH
jgi:adenylate cyclase